MAAQPSGVSTTPPSLVSSANLLRVHSNSSSRSLMKKLNKVGPSTDPWGTPLFIYLTLGYIPHLSFGIVRVPNPLFPPREANGGANSGDAPRRSAPRGAACLGHAAMPGHATLNTFLPSSSPMSSISRSAWADALPATHAASSARMKMCFNPSMCLKKTSSVPPPPGFIDY